MLGTSQYVIGQIIDSVYTCTSLSFGPILPPGMPPPAQDFVLYHLEDNPDDGADSDAPHAVSFPVKRPESQIQQKKTK